MMSPLRKLSSLALAVLLALGVFALPVSAADAPADAQIPAGQYSVTPSDGQGGGALTDSNRATSLLLGGGAEVAVSSGTPFDGLYLVWDTVPTGHEIAAGGETIAGREYLHEYVKLSSSVTEAVLRLPGEYTLCDIYLFSGDNLPDFVQVWQPACERADLLALPTHADDEHLFFGGALPYYAGELGLAVQVVYMTNHFGEPYRPHELLNGLWEVGVTAYPVMGPFPDLYASLESLESAEACFGREPVVEFQVEMIRRFKPRVVLGHDINGEYGHGAHILNAQTLLEALPLTGDETAWPESAALYGAYEVPKAYLHLWAENQIVMDWNVPLERFGGRTAFQMAEAGFAKHVSQVDYFTVTQGGTWEDCRFFGLAHTTIGADVVGGDFFENVDMSEGAYLPKVKEPEPSSMPASEPVSSQPAASQIDPQKEEGFPTWILVVFLIVLIVAVMIIALLVAAHNRKMRRHRQARRQSGKNTYHRRQ